MNPVIISPSTRSKASIYTPPQFALILAHEMRNPLASINLSANMLKALIKDEDLKRYVDIIIRSSNRINDLVNEAVNYQKPDKANPGRHSIHELLDEVINMSADRINLKKIVFRKSFGPQDWRTIFDRPKIKIALTNILINAIEAAPPVNGELRLSTKSANGNYLILIEDNGCGISKENLKRIFKPYFTMKPGGMGLGLATTYDILKSNNIKINVESEEGKGTRFILLFESSHKGTNGCLNDVPFSEDGIRIALAQE